jgi:diguanylate cyclase (GGDEF)-like protein
MKNINDYSIALINGLADITRHHDPKMLDESVLKTINDLFVVDTLHLFRLHVLDGKKGLRLVSSIDQTGIIATEENLPLKTFSTKLMSTLSVVVETKKNELLLNDKQTVCDVIYPILNADNNVFSLLVYRCSNSPSSTEQKMIGGILDVYSNYFSLLEKTQRDKLTGLFNRETLDTEITKVLLKATIESSSKTKENEKRYSNDLSTWLGLIDIDHFKSINDTYGHLYGDEVLILVARLMMNSGVREDDLVFRYGGEEFVVMLKAVDEEHAMVAFDRLRQNIHKHEFPQVENVAISIGVVQVLDQQSATDVIGMADYALYYAKDNGRNQLGSYKTLLEQGKISVTEHVENSAANNFIDKVIF